MDPAEPTRAPKRNGGRSRRLRLVDDNSRTTTAAKPPPADALDRVDDLYRSEWSGLVALAWSLTGDWALAEELAQDAFADAYRRWDEVDRLDRPGAWVRRAVINRSANTRRDRSADRRKSDRLRATAQTEPGADRTDPTGDQATDQVGDPVFWAAVRSLPEQQAACISLHYLEDRPVNEIAQIVGCRPAPTGSPTPHSALTWPGPTTPLRTPTSHLRRSNSSGRSATTSALECS